MNIKLKTIYSMIENQWIDIADIGCDHAFLSQYNYKIKDHKKFFNIDNKQGPLNNAIKNHMLLKHDAVFILDDGLNYLKNNNIKIDCCIISGIGGISAVHILRNDYKLIHNYIFQIENHQELIDEWIINNHYHIKEIKQVNDHKYEYLIYKVTKNESNI